MSTTLTVSGRVAADGAAGTLVVTSLLQWLPPLAALVGMIYYLLLISENKRFLQIVAWLGQHRVSVSVPTSWKVRLVDDWRHGWKWLSVQFIFLAGVLQATLMYFPAMLLPYVPYAREMITFCLVAAFIGRFIEQRGKRNEPDKPVQS